MRRNSERTRLRTDPGSWPITPSTCRVIGGRHSMGDGERIGRRAAVPARQAGHPDQRHHADAAAAVAAIVCQSDWAAQPVR